MPVPLPVPGFQIIVDSVFHSESSVYSVVKYILLYLRAFVTLWFILYSSAYSVSLRLNDFIGREAAGECVHTGTVGTIEILSALVPSWLLLYSSAFSVSLRLNDFNGREAAGERRISGHCPIFHPTRHNKIP